MRLCSQSIKWLTGFVFRVCKGNVTIVEIAKTGWRATTLWFSLRFVIFVVLLFVVCRLGSNSADLVWARNTKLGTKTGIDVHQLLPKHELNRPHGGAVIRSQNDTLWQTNPPHTLSLIDLKVNTQDQLNVFYKKVNEATEVRQWCDIFFLFFHPVNTKFGAKHCETEIHISVINEPSRSYSITAIYQFSWQGRGLTGYWP